LDADRNAVITGSKSDIYKNEFTVSNLNWIAIEGLREPLLANVKIRSAHDEARAVLKPADNGNVHVKFEESQLAITPVRQLSFIRKMW